MMAGVIRGTRDPEMFTRPGHLVAQVGNLCVFPAPMEAQVDNLCYGSRKTVPEEKGASHQIWVCYRSETASG